MANAMARVKRQLLDELRSRVLHRDNARSCQALIEGELDNFIRRGRNANNSQDYLNPGKAAKTTSGDQGRYHKDT